MGHDQWERARDRHTRVTGGPSWLRGFCGELALPADPSSLMDDRALAAVAWLVPPAATPSRRAGRATTRHNEFRWPLSPEIAMRGSGEPIRSSV